MDHIELFIAQFKQIYIVKKLNAKLLVKLSTYIIPLDMNLLGDIHIVCSNLPTPL